MSRWNAEEVISHLADLLESETKRIYYLSRLSWSSAPPNDISSVKEN